MSAVGNRTKRPRASVVRRHDEIMALLKAEGSVSVMDLAARLNCSTATVRRDLHELMESSGLRRFHGAVAIEALAMESAFQERLAVADDEKRAIAKAVVAELEPGQVVGLNGGTTTSQVAHCIAEKALSVTVVTNAVNIAFQLTAAGIRVVVVGGVLQPANYETTGPIALAALSNLHLDWAVLGANGVDRRFGASTHTEAEASVGNALAEQADRVMLAIDHSKLERTALFRMVGWDRVDAVACDRAGAAGLAGWGLDAPHDASEAAAGCWRVHRRTNGG